MYTHNNSKSTQITKLCKDCKKQNIFLKMSKAKKIIFWKKNKCICLWANTFWNIKWNVQICYNSRIPHTGNFCWKQDFDAIECQLSPAVPEFGIT